jgi:Peptidase family M1 domain
MRGAGSRSRCLGWAAVCAFALIPGQSGAQGTSPAPTVQSESSSAPAVNLNDPRALYEALNRLLVDPSRIYAVHDLNLRRDVVSLSFADGKIGFLQALDGRTSGAVFTGHGHVIAVPRDAGERRSLATYINVPIIDQPITKAYLRFTDGSAAELLRQIESDGDTAAPDATFTETWDKLLPGLAPLQSLRTMTDYLATDPLPYFYGLVESPQIGAFDVLIDPRREEQVTLGQPRAADGLTSYDVWASFRSRDADVPSNVTFIPLGYFVDTTIKDDFSIVGKTNFRLKAVRGGERIIPLELSRTLEVKQIQLADGRPLVFFQNDELGQRDVLRRGNDFVLVALPESAHEGDEINLTAEYEGTVIGDAGNGVKFVGERGAWYLHTGGIYFVPFDLKFRWPKRYTLVATGTNLESHDDGDAKTGHWQSKQPFSVAGFNLGEYRSAIVNGPPEVALFANLQLENAISARMRNNSAKSVTDAGTEPAQVIDPYALPPQNVPLLQAPPPSPAGVLKQLGREVSDSIQFFEKTNGPFPFDHLDVAQIPGTFGQGWPQLVYLSTLAFLPPEAQERAGMDEWSERGARELMPFHEVAHQWWGNVAAGATYRDVWLEEGMANYMAVLYADSRKPGDHRMAKWLDHYRSELLSKPQGSTEAIDEVGPLSLGLRLNGMQSRAYNVIVYGKGAWVIYMLSEMFRDPSAKDPDEKFRTFLRTVLEDYRFRAITTADFEREAEKYMTPVMDLEGSHKLNWFFDQWVNHSGIPNYSLNFTTKPKGQEFSVNGTLTQEGVEDAFTERVPLYISHGAGKPEFLGDVVTTGEATQFHFNVKRKPGHIIVDPYHTLLCQFE